MSYSLDIDPAAQSAVAALPADGLSSLAEVFAVLEVNPWTGRSINPQNPGASVRLLLFADGLGMLTYLILEREHRVDVLLVTWAG